MALAAPATAGAQDAAAPLPTIGPADTATGPGPSLQVVAARLEQSGADVVFDVHLNRAVPVGEFDPARGRILCIVLSPALASRRRVCVSTRAGRLSAALAPVDLDGRPTGTTRVLHRATVSVRGDVLRLRAPARTLKLALGRAVRWRVVVNWRDGGPCELAPDPLACVEVVPRRGELRDATRRVAPRRRGRLRLLATGDSMIQIVDGYLRSGLARRRATVVRSDAHIATGISKLGMLDWLRKARGQAGAYKPDVTVMFIGANDGFAMRTPAGARIDCCDARWTAEYARRVASMMRSYRRGGRSLVYWLTLPAPRAASFARVFDAVNLAIRRAAARAGGGVRVIDLVPVFTPGGRFRQTITDRGRTVSARQPDGIHLSAAGARIAASLVIDRLRADRALPRSR